MPLPTGEISFDNIRNEMRNGLGNPGAFAPAPWGSGGMPFNDASFRSRLTNTAQNAQLSISDIRGNAYQRFTIAADTTNYNIRNALVAAGWNGTAKGSADVVINSGIVVGTPSTGSYAMDTGGPWPGPSTIYLYNNGGYIVGMGGAGGYGAVAPTGSTAATTKGGAGSPGGPALLIQRSTTLINTGTIGGGGGGGGGGDGRTITSPIRRGQGGGGGGGRTGRTNSAGGPAPVNPGGAGTFSGAGGGGAGSGALTNPNPGGPGGGWGSAGVVGTNAAPTDPSPAGGAAGVAIQGWSAVVGSPSGSILGPVAG